MYDMESLKARIREKLAKHQGKPITDALLEKITEEARQEVIADGSISLQSWQELKIAVTADHTSGVVTIKFSEDGESITDITFNEVIKAAVQAHCMILAPKWKDEHWLAHGIRLWRHCWETGWNIDRISPSGNTYTQCRLEDDLPADNNQWWIAAKLLDIPTI